MVVASDVFVASHRFDAVRHSHRSPNCAWRRSCLRLAKRERIRVSAGVTGYGYMYHVGSETSERTPSLNRQDRHHGLLAPETTAR